MRQIIAFVALIPALSFGAVTTTTYGTSISGVPNIPNDVAGMNLVDAQSFQTFGSAPTAPAGSATPGLDNMMKSGGPQPKKSATGAKGNQQGGALDNLLNVGGGTGAGGQSAEEEDPVPMETTDVEEILRVDSINAYRGECPCPYSVNADGFECGIESAYYKPGGYRIYCYPHQDLRKQQLIFYRKTH